MNITKRSLLAASAMSMAAAAPGTAAAQAAEQPSEQPTAEAAAEGAADAAIVVTGSRIARRDFVANSPISTIGQEQIDNAGVQTLALTMNQLPQITATTGGNFGKSFVNLRGLGSVRTLVLLDGRRMMPADGFGRVDLNALPPSIIGSIEVITGGASAVYGSDAVSGVVNYKTRTDLTGLEIEARTSLTEVGDGASYDINAAFGNTFGGDRGRVLFAASYSDRDVAAQAKRRFYQGTGSPITTVVDGMLFSFLANNLPPNSALVDIIGGGDPATSSLFRGNVYGINPDGSLYNQAPAVNFRPTDVAGHNVLPGFGAVMYTAPYTHAQVPQSTKSFFGKVDYEVTPDITAYLRGMFTDYTQTNHQRYGGGIVAPTRLTVSPANALLPADVKELAATRPNPNGPLTPILIPGIILSKIGGFTQRAETTVYQLTAGLSGKIPGVDFSWDVSGSFGRTRDVVSFQNLISYDRAQQLLMAADAGASVCPGGFNLFNPSASSEECLQYIAATGSHASTLEQKSLEANLQGNLFELPGGNVSFALGANYRKNYYRFEPSDSVRVQPSNSLVGTALGINLSPRTEGSVDVKELYAELLIPLLADIPLIHRLELDFAGRYSDYNTSGGVWTYKGDANWQVTSWLGFRGGYEHAIRAPSVGELFSGASNVINNIGFAITGGGDPCDVNGQGRKGPNAAAIRQLCIEQGVPLSLVDGYTFSGSAASGPSSGNPNLKPETADTITIGLVARSPASSGIFRNAQLSIDYYDIRLKQAIGSISASLLLQQCFNLDNRSNPTYSINNPACAVIRRDPTGLINQIATSLSNLASYRTSGVDFQFDWAFPISGLRLGNDDSRLHLNLVVAYVDKYEIQPTANAATLDYVGTIGNQQIEMGAISHPKWKASGSITFDIGNYSVSFRQRYIGKMSNSANVGIPNGVQLGVAAAWYSDLTARADITNDLEIQAGINNLFDKSPPRWTGFGATDPATYDILGRRYFVGVRKRF